VLKVLTKAFQEVHCIEEDTMEDINKF
jgi:hypothetical protein